MADKITLDQVNELLGILRTDASVDHKVQLVTAAKSGIKQHNVPDHAVPVLFEALRTASSSQHAALVNAGFTALNHLLTRLSRQEPKHLTKEAVRTLPLIVEKLGDQKDKYRALAMQALVTLYKPAGADVERFVRNTAMVGKNPRAKEMSMEWLLLMHHEHGLPFRAYVPVLMELLEDADGMVRDAAKATVIDLFRTAPAAAKSDLKKQLKNFKVRPAIEQAIVRELAPSGTTTSTTATTTSVPLAPADPVARPESRAIRKQPSTNFGASVATLAERPTTPMPDKAEQAEPTYVNTQRELDELFREMAPWFEGKETEQNWLKREESINKLRRLIAGNAADFADAFMSNIRGMLDGIIKAIVTLRTSLCKEGCSLVQDLVAVFGSAIDPMVEILLQTLIKLAAGTKKISSQLANACVDAIIGAATYNTRILHHIWSACQDKNVQPRTYASGWLRKVLQREAAHKERVEHGGGLDLVEKSIKRGLNDANPGVRERMRATYWVYAGLWPVRAETLMAALDNTAQKLLQNDPHNPNSPKNGDAPAATARPGLGFSKSTSGAPPKPSLREAMLAKKKEALAASTAAQAPVHAPVHAPTHAPTRHLPPRPGSAMAHFSPVLPASSVNTSSSSASNSASAFTRPKAEGGLSVAPVRPTRRRPELHARPATAGPYSVRTHDHPSLEQHSPPEPIRTKPAITPKALGGSPKRNVARPRPGHQATASDSNLVTPSRAAVAAKKTSHTAHTAHPAHPAPSPRGSPPKARTAARAGGPGLAKSDAHRPPSASPSRTRTNTNTASSVRSESERERERENLPERAVTPTSPTPVKAPADVLVLMGNAPRLSHDLMDDAPASPPMKVYEDPFTEQPKPTASIFAPTALEDKPVNEDAGHVRGAVGDPDGPSSMTISATSGSASAPVPSPEKARQNARLLDSGIAKVKARELDVHGFRKLQGIIRDASSTAMSNGTTTKSGAAALFSDDRFDALLLGLFAYLEARVTNVPPEKVQDVKAQILATIKLLLKKSRDSFQPHVSRGLEALLAARAGYDARTHMVAGLELLADELVTLGDAAEISLALTRALDTAAATSPTSPASPTSPKPFRGSTSPHSLSMGLHVLKVLVDSRPSFQPSEPELAQLAGLARRCLDSTESGVRMDAVQLCVALHERVGDARFWDAVRGVKDDPKSLITYYIVKRQREQGAPVPA